MQYKIIRVPESEIDNDITQMPATLNWFAEAGWRLTSIALDTDTGDVIAAMQLDE